jgi:ABC-type sugar transport system permease subunit
MASVCGSDPVANLAYAGRIDRWRRSARRTSGWGGLLYVLPALAILLTFEVWPLIFGAWISLWKWDIGPVRFIGLENYARLFGDGFITRDFRGDPAPGEVANSLAVTIYYVLGTVPITLFLAFAIAYLLFQGLPGQGLLRTIYFLPYVTSSVAVALVFAWMFNSQVGVINAILSAVGLPTSTWLRDPMPAAERLLAWFGVSQPALDAWPDFAAGPSVALVVVIIFSIWTSLGYSVVVYLAGMTAIPRDLRDAARVDGAGPVQAVRSVIWPLLGPTTIFLVIFNTITAFQAFTPIYTLTRNAGMGRAEAGGPLDTTLTFTVFIFRNFYEKANSVGYAAALSLFLFAIMLGLTLAQFRLLGRGSGEG